jgi:hypothetical protein
VISLLLKKNEVTLAADEDEIFSLPVSSFQLLGNWQGKPGKELTLTYLNSWNTTTTLQRPANE